MTGKDPVTVIQEIVRRTHGAETKGSERVVVTARELLAGLSVAERDAVFGGNAAAVYRL